MAKATKLKSKISDIKGIEKITHAMQLVASAKLKKIANLIWPIKQYALEVYDVFNKIITQSQKSIYLHNNKEKLNNALWIVVNSNLGLCGGYNLNVNKIVLKNFKENDALFIIGSKGKTFFNARNKKIIGFENTQLNFSNQVSKKIALKIHDFYIKKQYRQIKIAYTKFINNILFEPIILDLLPIFKQSKKGLKTTSQVTEFDPGVEEILNQGIILYLNTIIYSSIMESQVCEYASRRLAMENATQNAKDLIKKLSLTYNRIRQDSITQEITEIVVGSDAQKKQ